MFHPAHCLPLSLSLPLFRRSVSLAGSTPHGGTGERNRPRGFSFLVCTYRARPTTDFVFLPSEISIWPIYRNMTRTLYMSPYELKWSFRFSTFHRRRKEITRGRSIPGKFRTDLNDSFGKTTLQRTRDLLTLRIGVSRLAVIVFGMNR